MERRNFVAVASALALASGTVLAQEFPAKPIHIYLGFAPGGGTDIMTRIVAPRMGERTAVSLAGSQAR